MRRPLAVLVLAAALSACPPTKPPEPEQKPPEAAQVPEKKLDPTTTGTVSGVVRFAGAPPASTMIRVASDAACLKANPGELDAGDVRVKDGRVENAFVWVKSGLEGYRFPAPAKAAHFDQRGCMYHPRVLGVRVDQEIEFQNSDETLHNIASKPKVAKAFNFVTMQGQTGKKSFNKPEVMVRIGCDVHPWMRAFVGVVDHPFFQVTGADGGFQLAGLPPGAYVLGVWSERLGEVEVQVALGPREAKAVEASLPGPPPQ